MRIKVTIHEAQPQSGHKTMATVEPTLECLQEKVKFSPFSIVAVAQEIVKSHEELLDKITEQERLGVAEVEIFIMPAMMGGG